MEQLAEGFEVIPPRCLRLDLIRSRNRITTYFRIVIWSFTTPTCPQQDMWLCR